MNGLNERTDEHKDHYIPLQLRLRGVKKLSWDTLCASLINNKKEKIRTLHVEIKAYYVLIDTNNVANTGFKQIHFMTTMVEKCMFLSKQENQ